MTSLPECRGLFSKPRGVSQGVGQGRCMPIDIGNFELSRIKALNCESWSSPKSYPTPPRRPTTRRDSTFGVVVYQSCAVVPFLASEHRHWGVVSKTLYRVFGCIMEPTINSLVVCLCSELNYPTPRRRSVVDLLRSWQVTV